MKDRLRKLRESRQLTQREFGIKIGVSDKVVSKWERGVSEPDIRKIKLISETFSVGIEELVGAPRLENVAFPARKAEKGILYYSVSVSATLAFIAAVVAFCVLYAQALKGTYELSRPVGDAATCFIPTVFGVMTVCVFTAVSHIRFNALPMLPDKHTQGKTLNEVLLLPRSIRNVYLIYGKWLALIYLLVQLWNTLNVAAYFLTIDAVTKYVLSGCILFCIVPTSLVAGFFLKKTAEKDRESCELFREKENRIG